MLVIRNVQMEALAVASRELFCERLARWLPTIAPDRCRALGEAGVQSYVTDGVARAAGYGITSERDVAAYFELVMGLAPEFETRPELAWLVAVLRRTRVPAPLRLERIRARLAEERGDGAGAR
jgi:hypothetical protein